MDGKGSLLIAISRRPANDNLSFMFSVNVLKLTNAYMYLNKLSINSLKLH